MPWNIQCVYRYKARYIRGGHHSQLGGGGGGWNFCRGHIIYFNRARRRAENFIFYHMFM